MIVSLSLFICYYLSVCVFQFVMTLIISVLHVLTSVVLVQNIRNTYSTVCTSTYE